MVYEYAPEAFTPHSIAELAKVRGKRPRAFLYAGGLFALKGYKGSFFSLPKSVIALSKVTELTKISRNERYIEFGACVPIQNALDVGRFVLPAALYQALEETGPPSVKNWATIGGNLCVAEQRMDSFAALFALDAQIELRSFTKEGKRKNVRWLSLSRFIRTDGLPDLLEGEILTRIRVPYEKWDTQSYRKLGRKYSCNDTELVFCALAQLDKGLIMDLRLVLGDGKRSILRCREIEADLIGRKFPLPERDFFSLVELIDDFFLKRGAEFDMFFRYRAKALILEFLRGGYSHEGGSARQQD